MGGGRLAIEHLLACGRRNIVHITGEIGFRAARDRAEGAAATLAEAGLDLVGGRSYFGSWDESWGRAAAHMVVERHTEVDAVYCGSDQIARGVLDALRELRRDVPAAISVLGFDNWEATSADSRPRLTSIDMNLKRLGTVAGQRLFEAMGGAEPRSEEFPGRLVVRESTLPVG